MGASKMRLVQQSLTESVVLAVLGGVAGIVIAFAGVKVIVALAFHSAHFVPIDATPSFAVLGFAFGMSLITGLLFGTAPAWFAARTNPAEVLHGAGTQYAGQPGHCRRRASSSCRQRCLSFC